MQLAIVGYGVVGRHMASDVRWAGHECRVYDVRPVEGAATQDEINACEAAFVCVPTPQGPGGAADLSAIDDVFSWLRVPVAIIRSTVPPGTTERLQRQGVGPQSTQAVAFVPEFIGEGVNAPYSAMRQPPFLIIGGEEWARDRAGEVLAGLYNSECEFVHTDATTAEVAKYAENFFLALKVTWANELYDICERVGADFGQMMAAVTHDYRIGRSHTHVYPHNRGWDGRCLPKDTAALLARVGEDTAPLLAALRRVNEEQRLRGGTI